MSKDCIAAKFAQMQVSLRAQSFEARFVNG
jgi:hypothetical protein